MMSESTKALFSDRTTNTLKEYFMGVNEEFTGMIPVADVQMLCNELNLTVEQLMIMLLYFPTMFAVVPISNYKVGALCLGESGNLY